MTPWFRNLHQDHVFAPMGILRFKASQQAYIRVRPLSLFPFHHLLERLTSSLKTRFPKSLPFVILDMLERSYLYGFALLQAFVILFPILISRSSSTETSTMEFLPLMLTSVYCAVGLVWAFLRLSVLYLQQ